MSPDSLLPQLLGLAWLLPLASFALIVLFGPKMGKAGILASYVATGAIGGSFLLSLTAFGIWHFGHLGGTRELAVPAGEHAAVDHQAPHGAANSGAANSGTANSGTANSGTANSGTANSGAAESAAGGADEAHGEQAAHAGHGIPTTPPKAYTEDWYTLARFGSLKLTISYYIDALTVLMFTVVSLIAMLIHFYAYGYMHDELHEVVDHEVTLDDGHHLHRPGRFHRFFQYLSLFCFSMLGLVIAGNILMVFVFWELVGICSYFLIGFYIERKSASNAANKAFIVNRIGDFGMLIGLMILWAGLGTFAFGDVGGEEGIFSRVRPASAVESSADPAVKHVVTTSDGKVTTGQLVTKGEESLTIRMSDGKNIVIPLVEVEDVQRVVDRDGHFAPLPPSLTPESIETAHEPYALRVPDGLIRLAAQSDIAAGADPTPAQMSVWRREGYGYWLLVIAGVGIFCGCIGKSAQFPLHVWLPDAMEGPTPVSALVHSATMVAAGVYLTGRFYPVFAPEVLLVIAYVGAITLFLAATIAITAVDIKRVLAYSTVSQLGYMMLGLGTGGWAAGLFHLVTHAFFKSLLFMCSGSVIHATHTNDMRQMGGLRHKMPWTAYTMLVGVLAIYGAAIPIVGFGMSGYYSKDSIVAQVLSFYNANPGHGGLFFAFAVGGAGITAFYMFRLWFMTFAGKPRDHHVYEHAHESPRVMYVPLVILALFAVSSGFPWFPFSVEKLLHQARPVGAIGAGVIDKQLKIPEEYLSHATEIHGLAEIALSAVAFAGLVLAVAFYGLPRLNPAEVKAQFPRIYRLLWNKWYFDELYNVLFVRPVLFFSKMIANFDRQVIDRMVDGSARVVRSISSLDDLIDRYFVDGAVNLFAAWTYSVANSLRGLQTGKLRQYVMLIVIGTIALMLLIRWSVAATP